MEQRERETIEASEIEFYKNIYQNEVYNKTGNKLRLNRELTSLIKLSKQNKLRKVLSIGCGHGEFELLLSPFAETITAVDLSPDAIKLAKRKQEEKDLKNIEYRCQSFSSIDWDEKFDAIICLAFLHHVPEQDMKSFLSQAYNHLNSGGFFYSQDPNVNGILRKIGRIILGANYDKYHTSDERELDIDKLIAAFKEVGFDSFLINHLDLSLIPAIYMFPKGYEWLMYLCLWSDKVWSLSPFAKWASGFALISRKK